MNARSRDESKSAGCQHESSTHTALEKMLGRFDPAATSVAITDRERAVDKLEASQGQEGLMLFVSNDHGVLWALLGKKARKAIRYSLGNPLIAMRMTQKYLGAALCARLEGGR